MVMPFKLTEQPEKYRSKYRVNECQSPHRTSAGPCYGPCGEDIIQNTFLMMKCTGIVKLGDWSLGSIYFLPSHFHMNNDLK